jgi:hypothetical protein
VCRLSSATDSAQGAIDFFFFLFLAFYFSETRGARLCTNYLFGSWRKENGNGPPQISEVPSMCGFEPVYDIRGD